MQWSTEKAIKLFTVGMCLLGVIVIIAVVEASVEQNDEIYKIIEQIISTAIIELFIIFFTLFMPLLYFSYSQNKKPLVKEDISLRFTQTNMSISKLDDTFQEVYGDKQYLMPVLLLCVLTLGGWILAFFPEGLSGYMSWGTISLIKFIGGIAERAPPITYGFLGAYFFSVQLLFRRYVQSDLKPEVFMFANMRILITFILTFVITLFFKSTNSNFPAPVLALSFFIGIFPNTGLKLIEKNISKLLRIKSDKFGEPLPLTAIQGLTMWHEVRLFEEDIENIQNLATADIKKLLVTTRFDAQRLMDWVDQALLLIHIGEEKITDWRNSGIRTATDLMDLCETKENAAKVAKSVKISEDEVEIIACTLKKDPNIQYVSSFWNSMSG